MKQTMPFPHWNNSNKNVPIVSPPVDVIYTNDWGKQSGTQRIDREKEEEKLRGKPNKRRIKIHMYDIVIACLLCTCIKWRGTYCTASATKLCLDFLYTHTHTLSLARTHTLDTLLLTPVYIVFIVARARLNFLYTFLRQAIRIEDKGWNAALWLCCSCVNWICWCGTGGKQATTVKSGNEISRAFPRFYIVLDVDLLRACNNEPLLLLDFRILWLS